MNCFQESFFALIRNEICNKPLPDNIEYDIARLFVAAKKHEIVNLIADSIIRNNLVKKTDDWFKKLRDQRGFAISRETQSAYFYEQIRKKFNENGIQFVPLKGAIIRGLYPECWMRTSCDIDILVHESDIKKATKLLVELGFETNGKRDFHDISFYYGSDMHLELHFSICENLRQLDSMLNKVWDYVECVDGYEFRETEEYYVFHHIAHMAYHFLAGGCGIRPFIDLWLLKQKGYYREEKLLPLLEECHLVKFYQTCCELMQVWMDANEHNELTLQMEKFILTGGAFGTSKNSYAVESVAHQGKKRYLIKLAFPPLKDMCEIYPSLNKRKWLLPCYYIYRVFSKTFGKDRKRAKIRYLVTMSQSKEDYKSLSNMLNDLELKP